MLIDSDFLNDVWIACPSSERLESLFGQMGLITAFDSSYIMQPPATFPGTTSAGCLFCTLHHRWRIHCPVRQQRVPLWRCTFSFPRLCLHIVGGSSELHNWKHCVSLLPQTVLSTSWWPRWFERYPQILWRDI